MRSTTHGRFFFNIFRFRWDYLENQENLTSFAYLRKHGTSIPFVNPVFPTEDYPVWTTIATGLLRLSLLYIPFFKRQLNIRLLKAAIPKSIALSATTCTT
jgi:hypothetical protein